MPPYLEAWGGSFRFTIVHPSVWATKLDLGSFLKTEQKRTKRLHSVTLERGPWPSIQTKENNKSNSHLVD